MAISGSETQPQNPRVVPQIEVESVKCDSCGFTEDCTPAYISRVRDRFQGRWICGLCSEAVKDEVRRSDKVITTEEALKRHTSFCESFRSWSPLHQTEHPISVMGRVLLRNLDSPRSLRSRSNSISSLPGVDEVQRPQLVRSESCFSALSR
ncbi:hypothetical protein HS088_TW09G01173 [Tripterygium wilfordii]|uniref:DUF1677 family protein n=1 Tax=Tripterygium wilfordii TaxID=458696 RepID=A0A7J7DA08_TRIWF|nr:uncharacterized protein LOC120006267 [Tripterygium wilfordii]KAF5743108.1 hypothetical protein HS088_TW09G01173 [Tripterygium wilfordii]